jgi:predicted O-methyltransferase YrrM
MASGRESTCIRAMRYNCDTASPTSTRRLADRCFQLQQEKDRLDIFHKLFLVSRQGALHKAPLIPSNGPPRILDLGTGTGIWAIDMAE